MGWLHEGTPLTWEETKNIGEQVKKRAIKQFINYYRRMMMDVHHYNLKFGDEMEYIIVKFDRENRRARVSLKTHEILEQLYGNEQNSADLCSIWMPEYAGYMIEGIPKIPFDGSLLTSFGEIEKNLKKRREEVQQLLDSDELLMSVSTYPRLGCEGFSWPAYAAAPNDSTSGSLFLPDQTMYPHYRYRCLTRDLIKHKGHKIAINVPIYKDINTPSPFIEKNILPHNNKSAKSSAVPDHVYMDATGFGLGNCCLQVTLQAYCLEEARVLYDQLAAICPLMLALTAASSIFRGYLTQIDSQWNVTCASLDCRTDEEKGLKPLKRSKYRIPKSRYDSISLYLTEEGQRLNDIHAACDVEAYFKMKDAGVDNWLCQHIAYHFIRRPIALVREHIEEDNDRKDIRLFQAMYLANYHSMRLKLPTPELNIGWRVEFRPCETQITDFENAAIICFVVLLSRTILSYNLNFLLPISKIDENMKIANKLDAVIREKFWFRKNFNSANSFWSNEINNGRSRFVYEKPICTRMTINEIMNGKEEYPGLISLVNSYISDMHIDANTYVLFMKYLDYIRFKTIGKIPTAASWMRKFVRNHSAYKFDSVVTDEINYDLLSAIGEIQKSKINFPMDVFGGYNFNVKNDA